MSVVTIGPMLVTSERVGVISESIEHSGWRLELAGDQFGGRLEIYRALLPNGREKFGLDDYFVPVDGLPFAVSYYPKDQANLETGRFLQLDCVLASLYRKHEVARSLTSLLTELRGCLLFDFMNRWRADGALLVSPLLRAAGFEVTSFFCYGTGLTVSLGWAFPEDRSNTDSKTVMHATSIEYRPGPGRTLGKGKWCPPIETSVRFVLGQDLIARVRRKPERCFSEQGLRVALDEFKWTKVSLLTRDELKAARLQFIRDHPELHHELQKLARALRSAGLWSDTTQLSDISKQLPKLIAAAGV